MTHPNPQARRAEHHFAWAGLTPEQATLVRNHLPLARYLAATIGGQGRTWWGAVDEDDLRQEAVIGLVKAVRKYDPERGTTFGTYATHVVRGHLRDHLRDVDHLTRAHRDAIRRGDSDLPRIPWSIEATHDALGDTAPLPRHYDDHTLFEERDARDAFIRYAATQPWWRGHTPAVTILYACQGLTMAETARRIGITEGRVSQIFKTVLAHAHTWGRAHIDEHPTETGATP